MVLQVTGNTWQAVVKQNLPKILHCLNQFFFYKSIKYIFLAFCIATFKSHSWKSWYISNFTLLKQQFFHLPTIHQYLLLGSGQDSTVILILLFFFLLVDYQYHWGYKLDLAKNYFLASLAIRSDCMRRTQTYLLELSTDMCHFAFPHNYLLLARNTDVMTEVAVTTMVTLGIESSTRYNQEERKNLTSGDIMESPLWPCSDYSQTPLS